MEKSKKMLKISLGVLILTSISLIFYYLSPIVFAWVGPTQSPTGGNIDIVDVCSDLGITAVLDYSGQANIVYDDYKKNYDAGYISNAVVSAWTQTSVSPVIWKDERTGLYWSATQGETATNSFTIATCDFYSMARGAYTGGDVDCGDAINRCADLNGVTHGGRTGWYLPSQHELMQAHLNGMYIQTSHSFTTASYFWASTEVSHITTSAWALLLGNGNISSREKTTLTLVRCVSRD